MEPVEAPLTYETTIECLSEMVSSETIHRAILYEGAKSLINNIDLAKVPNTVHGEYTRMKMKITIEKV